MRRQGAGLAVGAGLSGVLAYVFFAVVTRSLGSAEAAPVSVLWAYWSFAGAALTFPLQHWISRTVAARGGERSTREALPAVAVPCLVLAVVATALSWAARGPLFRSDDPWFPLLVGAVTLGSAVMGLTRGVLSARGRFAAVGAGLVAENLLRCLAALVLALLGVDDPVAYGLCLVAGYAAAAFWPSAWRLTPTGMGGHDVAPMAFLGGAAGGQLAGQAALTGGPVVLALAGGSAAHVTVLFAALALFRAPYTLAVGAVAPLTGRFTALVVHGDRGALRRVRLGLALGGLAGGVAAGLLGATVGPTLVSLVFGPDVALSGALAGVLAAGSALAVVNLVAGLVVLAQGHTPRLVGAWTLAFVPGSLWFALGGLPLLGRTSWAFLVVEIAAFALLLAAGARDGRPTGARPA